ncbi:hypothetical protein BJX99DRAFT_252085 [Aspergillus californicus]
MLHNIDDTTAEEAVAARTQALPPIFKMKKTKDELRVARKLLKDNMSALTEEETEAQILISDDELQYAHGMVESMTDIFDMTEPEILDYIENDERADNSRANDHSERMSANVSKDEMVDDHDYEVAEEDGKNRRRSDPPAYIVSHPWHIVDYHLYLCSAERDQTLEARRDGTYIYDGLDCRRLLYADFVEDRGLMSFCFPGDQPQLLFGILPIADRQHFADRNPSFDGRHYILGFDYDCKTLYARHFDWFPHDLSDIWCIWDSGIDVYTTTVPDLMHIMDTTLGKGQLHVGMGVLSSSEYCRALEPNDDPGLEIIIATLWCQWLLDFNELLFKTSTGSLPEFQERLGSYVEQGRLVLQRASFRAWFAVRDGYSKEHHKCKTTINQYTNDLYTFEKSAEDGSLKGQSWAAPGLGTCNQIRHNERMQRKQRVQRRLEDLFVVPEAEAFESQENVLQGMLEKAQQNAVDLDLSARVSTRILKTPSPKKQRDTVAPPEQCSSPSSPGIVTPTTELYDEFEPLACHHIPLPILLELALAQVQARPEFDTLANRGQFGDLFADMGIELQPRTLENDSRQLKLDVQLNENSPTSGLRSPVHN